MKYVSRFFCGMCLLFLSVLFFQIDSKGHEYGYSDDVVDEILNLEIADDATLLQSCRLTVEGNITLNDSTSKEIGNIMKKKTNPDNTVEVRRFIHNYGKNSTANSNSTNNTFIGIRAGNFSMTDVAVNNTAIGVDSLRHNVSGNRNTVIGKGAATENSTGNSNVVVGYNALRNNKRGSFNVALGDSALISLNSNNVASSNTAVGRNALRGLIEGSDNLAIGALAGFFNNETEYTGSRNVFVGYKAGSSENPGSDNIYIGYQAGSLASGGVHNIYMGNLGAQESHTIRIGIPFNAEQSTGQHTCVIDAIYNVQLNEGALPVVIDANGQLGTMSSSRRFKDTINQIHNESEALYYLSPVSFVLTDDETVSKRYGLIPEEVGEYFSDLVIKNNDGVPYAVRYELLPVLLLNEIKKHQHAIEQHVRIINKQKNAINEQKYTMEKQERDMQKHEYDMEKQDDIMLQQKREIDNVLCAVADLQSTIRHFMVNNN